MTRRQRRRQRVAQNRERREIVPLMWKFRCLATAVRGSFAQLDTMSIAAGDAM